MAAASVAAATQQGLAAEAANRKPLKLRSDSWLSKPLKLHSKRLQRQLKLLSNSWLRRQQQQQQQHTRRQLKLSSDSWLQMQQQQNSRNLRLLQLLSGSWLPELQNKGDSRRLLQPLQPWNKQLLQLGCSLRLTHILCEDTFMAVTEPAAGPMLRSRSWHHSKHTMPLRLLRAAHQPPHLLPRWDVLHTIKWSECRFHQNAKVYHQATHCVLALVVIYVCLLKSWETSEIEARSCCGSVPWL